MATQRIIATTLSADDRKKVQALIKNAEITEAFIIGDLDDAEIARLRAANIIVEPVSSHDPFAAAGGAAQAGFWKAVKEFFGAEDPQSVSDGPLAGKMPNVSFGAGNKPKSIPGIRGSQIYNCLLRIKGPLLDPWHDLIGKAGGSIAERYNDNSLIVRCRADGLDALRALDFVEAVELFSARMTPKRWSTKAIVADDAPRDATQTEWNIRLQSAADFDGVKKWLDSEQIEITGIAASNRKIRVKGPTSDSKLDDARHHPGIMEIEEYVVPITCNDQARILLGFTGKALAQQPLLDLKGIGQIVGIADTGLDTTHDDFEPGRVLKVFALGRKAQGDTSDPAGHGTHVAGTLLGSGTASNGQFQGVAPGAKLVFQSLLDSNNRLSGLPTDIGELFKEAYDLGARVHSNSWGSSFGDGFEAFYRFDSRDLDEFVDSHRDMLIVVAAGNEGTVKTDINPEHRKGFVDWASVITPATAKNALTVGASRSSRSEGGWSQKRWGEVWQNLNMPPIGAERISGNAEEMAGFSSRGPTGSRVKPDVVAPGTDIVSVRSIIAEDRRFWAVHEANPKYAYLGGTSMATPLVAGCAVLVREYYQRIRGVEPSAALLKATLINGTTWLKGPGALDDREIIANYHQGFGRVDMRTTLPAPGSDLRLAFSDNWKAEQKSLWLRTGSVARFLMKLKAGHPLRVCLVWTDPPGPGLQNVLGLSMEHQTLGRRWYGNQDITKPVERFDRDNNVQIIRLSDAPDGDYVISVVAQNLLRPGQDFALVVLGAFDGAADAIDLHRL